MRRKLLEPPRPVAVRGRSMNLEEERERVTEEHNCAIVIVATSLLLLGVGVVTASRPGAGDGIGNPLVGTPTGTPTTTQSTDTPAPSATEPATPTATATEPSGDPECTAEECACMEAPPEQAARPMYAGVARQPRAVATAAPVKWMKIQFSVKTDAMGMVNKFDRAKDVKITVNVGGKDLEDPSEYRNYISGEMAADDPKDCYRLQFDSRRMERCDELGEVKVFVNNLRKDVHPLIQEPAVITEPDGFRFTRYFYSLGPRRANAEFTIEVMCLMR